MIDEASFLEQMRDTAITSIRQETPKFVYYVVGLDATLLGMSVQFAIPGSGFPWFLVLAWSCFLVSLVAGLRTVERLIRRLDFEMSIYVCLTMEQSCRVITAGASSESVLQDPETGKPTSLQELQTKANRKRVEAQDAIRRSKRRATQVSRAFIVSMFAMGLGVLFHLIHRVLVFSAQ